MNAPQQTTVHTLAADFVAVDDEIKELEERVKSARSRKRLAEDTLLTAMIDACAPSIDVLMPDGTKARVYPMSRVYARRNPDVLVEDFCDAVAQAGYSDLVKVNVNTSSLSAVIREIAEQAGVRSSGEEKIAASLPPVLANAVVISSTPSLSIRRS